MPSIPVLYIAGSGRSGSTLLAGVLGSVDGVFNAGELRFLWERGLADDARCACHSLVVECPVWTSVFEQTNGGIDDVDTGTIKAELASLTRMRNLPNLVRTRNDPESVPETTRRTLGSLYEAIGATTGAKLIIDSSKLPPYALLLSQIPEIDLKVLHLVRDPRAAAWSWMRSQATGTVAGFEESMDRFSPAKSASLWSAWNATARYLWRSDAERYMAVRYEDFVADPEGVVSLILDFAGVSNKGLRFTRPDTALIAPSHSIAGNPNRMRHGETKIVADREWESAMPKVDRLKVTALTAPLLPGFGYGVRQ